MSNRVRDRVCAPDGNSQTKSIWFDSSCFVDESLKVTFWLSGTAAWYALFAQLKNQIKNSGWRGWCLGMIRRALSVPGDGLSKPVSVPGAVCTDLTRSLSVSGACSLFSLYVCCFFSFFEVVEGKEWSWEGIVIDGIEEVAKGVEKKVKREEVSNLSN